MDNTSCWEWYSSGTMRLEMVCKRCGEIAPYVGNKQIPLKSCPCCGANMINGEVEDVYTPDPIKVDEAITFHKKQLVKCWNNEAAALARGDRPEVISNIRRKRMHYAMAIVALKGMEEDVDKKPIDT